MRVLSFGSLNIDYVYRVPRFVTAGETLASFSLDTFNGGKGLNQSIAMARAGLPVCHAGAVGPDGAFLLEELTAAGVDVANVIRMEDIRTGHAIIQRDPSGDNCILLFGGANQKVTEVQIGRVLSRFTKEDVLVLQNEISGLSCLIEKAREKGMYIVLNPSPMDESLPDLLPGVDLLILNEIEAAQIIGEELPPEELGKRLRVRYPSLAVVLTVGAEGAFFLSDSVILHEPARETEVADTTAAGDTFTGYFLAGYLKDRDPARALRYAAAAAAIAVSREGAAPSIPEREEVLSKLGETR